MYWMITFREEWRDEMESGGPPKPPIYRTTAIAEHPLDWLARFKGDAFTILFAMPIDQETHEKHQWR